MTEEATGKPARRADPRTLVVASVMAVVPIVMALNVLFDLSQLAADRSVFVIVAVLPIILSLLGRPRAASPDAEKPAPPKPAPGNGPRPEENVLSEDAGAQYLTGTKEDVAIRGPLKPKTHA